MSRPVLFVLLVTAVFLQAGAYGLTFLLPRLFAVFGANEKAVGTMLLFTTAATLLTVLFSGHLADRFGRVRILGHAGLTISLALLLYGQATGTGPLLAVASILLGAGWGLTYALVPVVVSALVDPAERVRYFAMLSVAFMAGFGISPVLTSHLEKNGFAVADAFHLYAGLCALSAVLFYAAVRPARRHRHSNAPELPSSLGPASIAAVFRSRARTPIVLAFLGACVFAGINNFQTVLADAKGLDYSTFFLVYTLTVIAFRVVLVGINLAAPYRVITLQLLLTCASVLLFMLIGGSTPLYVLFAMLFGIGYGASFPIIYAMAANDAAKGLVPQSLQLFALVYFGGVFGFPFIAGWLIVEAGHTVLLGFVALVAAAETLMAARRALSR